MFQIGIPLIASNYLFGLLWVLVKKNMSDNTGDAD
jgi:hypothetical protein